MKLFRKSFAIMAAAIALVSCEDNDDKNKIIIPGPPVGVEIRYEVSVSADMITQISYKMGDGDMFYGQPEPDGPRTSWTKSLIALYAQMPETAFLQVKCLNPTATAQNCTLNIYRGDVLIKTETDPVAPIDADPETEDTVTITTSVIISE